MLSGHDGRILRERKKRKIKKILHWDCSTFKRLYGTERQITGQIWWLCEFMGNRGCHAAIEDEHNENTSELETKWIHLISASVCRLKNSATRSSCAVTMLPNGFFFIVFFSISYVRSYSLWCFWFERRQQGIVIKAPSSNYNSARPRSPRLCIFHLVVRWFQQRSHTT